MQNYYHENIKIFFSIENLEGIQNLFKDVKGTKGDFHKFLTYSDSNEFFFNSNDYLITKKNMKKEKLDESIKNEKYAFKEESSDEKIEENAKSNIRKSRNFNFNEMDNNKKKKECESLFNDKYINDEYELISEEIFKCLYKNEQNIKCTYKYKMLIEIIIQAILYSNKIKLNIYKLNLFISIIIMTLYKIMENLKEKKNKKKKTINYFIDLLDKNIQYAPSKEKIIKDNSLNEDSEIVDNLNTEKEKINKNDGNNKHVNDKKIKNDKDLDNKVDKQVLKNEKFVGDNGLHNEIEDMSNSKETSMNKSKEYNKEIEDKNLLISDEGSGKWVDKNIILFQYHEAKYIIKYMFENIFSIYNILEYIFLFSPFPLDLTFTNNYSSVSPIETFSMNDQIKHNKDELTDNKLTTNSYIKEVLNVPFFVLDKFYNNIDELKEKIDSIIT